MTANDRSTDDAVLFEIIRERSFRRGKFRLASGRESELYFNLKPTMMSPKGALLSARALLARIWPESPDYVGGLEMGAVPVIAAMAAVSEAEGRPVKTFFVRKQPKGHGTMDMLEGLAPGETLKNARVMIIDDVATSGGSILKAVDAVRAAGAQVSAALVLIDREEGAAEMLQAQNMRLLSVFRGRAFLGDAAGTHDESAKLADVPKTG
ncbi:MAG: orotate phosphoribosyltransferase [Alphaproteobacteria bacterium]|nr:orotate phosphoribosyltransferase [Alphaproteobacteria bacterium]